MKATVYADLDNIVFEGRERGYGAYEMRAKSNRLLTRAALIACLLFVSGVAFPKIMSWIMPPDITIIAEKDGGVILSPDIPLPPPPDMTETPPEPLPPPPKMPRAKIRTIAFPIPRPAPDDLVLDDIDIPEIEDLDNAAVGLENIDSDIDGYNYDFDAIGDGNGELPSDLVVAEDVKEPGFRDWVDLDNEPRPINMDDLVNLIGYPQMAKEAEIEGKVTLRVFCDKFGHYIKHVVIKDPHPLLTKAVTDNIHNLQMTPGIQAGKPINVWVTVPIDFNLVNK